MKSVTMYIMRVSFIGCLPEYQSYCATKKEAVESFCSSQDQPSHGRAARDLFRGEQVFFREIGKEKQEFIHGDTLYAIIDHETFNEPGDVLRFFGCKNLEELQFVADNEGIPDKVMRLARGEK